MIDPSPLEPGGTVSVTYRPGDRAAITCTGTLARVEDGFVELTDTDRYPGVRVVIFTGPGVVITSAPPRHPGLD